MNVRTFFLLIVAIVMAGSVEAQVVTNPAITGSSPAAAQPVSVAQGTLTADASPIATTTTWNNAGVVFHGVKFTFTDAASAAGSMPFQIFGGAAGATNLLSVDKTGAVISAGQISSGAAMTATGGVQAGSGNIIGWSGVSRMVGSVDGRIALFNNALTSFSLLQFGCTTSSCGAIKANGTSMEARLSDDSAYANFRGLNIFTGAGGGFYLNNTLMTSATAPTVSSGFGTSPTIPGNNGTAVFTVNVGTGGTASSGVLTMPASATGWACDVNMEGVVPTTLTKQTGNTTTSVTVTNYTVSTGATAAWAASTILTLKCGAR